jgi:hypothetical protein
MQIYDTMGKLIRQLDEMLVSIASGDEKRIEGGEGLKGDEVDDLALSGVKLYKGETLLELTERWRFIYDRLCTADDDNEMTFEYVFFRLRAIQIILFRGMKQLLILVFQFFSLSRIPDIHDNVRFE